MTDDGAAANHAHEHRMNSSGGTDSPSAKSLPASPSRDFSATLAFVDLRSPPAFLLARSAVTCAPLAQSLHDTPAELGCALRFRKTDLSSTPLNPCLTTTTFSVGALNYRFNPPIDWQVTSRFSY